MSKYKFVHKPKASSQQQQTTVVEDVKEEVSEAVEKETPEESLKVFTVLSGLLASFGSRGLGDKQVDELISLARDIAKRVGDA